MRKVVLYAVCVVLVGLGFQSCKPNDQKVQTEVENAVKSKYNAVSASVKDGVVTLTGELTSEVDRLAAESTALTVKNVKSVVNNITVKQPVPEIKINPDDTIRSTITSKLSADGYKDVKVDVSNGEVTLSGSLKRADLQKVMKIANEAGVKKVNNNLTLK